MLFKMQVIIYEAFIHSRTAGTAMYTSDYKYHHL